ncbi:MAG TPA: biotin--[acetyl-CoA-carboxylase] ligase [Novosphingobium sp.]|nr:biotin--[acetyl-CoA-carboxylase] ligase [Novosphingobium sp.]
MQLSPGTIRFIAETGSTSTDLAELLAGGALIPEGEWLVADRQTAGRGRLGRDWLDGQGNFMGSTVVHRGVGDPPGPSLALVSALAVHAGVARYLPDHAGAMLKWPNDLLVKGAKLAGILLEASHNAVIVGVGVNLVSAPEVTGRRTAALSDFGSAPDRDTFAQELAHLFAAELARWRHSGLAPIVHRWQGLAHAVGTRLGIAESDGTVTQGCFAGLADDGGLRLRLDRGDMRVIHAGEVMLVDNEAQ